YREGIQWWQQNRQPNEPTVISGFAEYSYIYFLFYGPIPPRDWIASQRIEGVTFIPLGQAVEPYYQRQDQRTFYFLRPFELSSVQPEKVVRVPSGDPIWKWVVLDARQTTHE
ncbi:MAG: hypothetical protein RBU29_17960, partial [bacterium]|nr:hypothetical protein [bacterium]